MKTPTWVFELKNIKQDSDFLIRVIETDIENYIEKKKDIVAMHLSLAEIWNLKDFFCTMVTGNEF